MFIKDHLIKIHHLNTSEMRKPFLKKIKDDSRWSFLNFDNVQSFAASNSSCTFTNSSVSNLIPEKNPTHSNTYLNGSMGTYMTLIVY